MKANANQFTFTKKQWAALTLVQAPTETTGAIKKDFAENRYEWIAGGKRVTAKRL